MTRVSRAWAWRALLAVALVGAALVPGHATGSASPRCRRARCRSVGAVRWIRRLPGSWAAASGIAGTVPSPGEAYAATGGRVAAVGFGLRVLGYDVRTGHPLWACALTGFPVSAAVAAIRVWPGEVTVGVSYPDARTGGTARDEVVLSARTGRRIRAYPAAAFGGAVAAAAGHTVIVGPTSVTSYDNASGRTIWRRPTGSVPQAWRVDSGELYVTVVASGYLGSAPVTGLRRISLSTGAEQVIRPAGPAFAGTLSGAFDGVVLFTGPRGLTAYSGRTGRRLWRRVGVTPATEDALRHALYVSDGSRLLGLDPRTGTRIPNAAIPAPSRLYAVRGGVALGLDQGALGGAWGYDIARHRVIWTTRRLPWPHYFVDLSGIGGSAGRTGSTVLLAFCARLGAAPADGGTGQPQRPCLRPELAAVSR